MLQKYRDDNVLNNKQAAEALGVSIPTLYRIRKRFEINHPYRRGWFLKHRIDAYVRGNLRPTV